MLKLVNTINRENKRMLKIIENAKTDIIKAVFDFLCFIPRLIEYINDGKNIIYHALR